MANHISSRDYETLSAYLDGQINGKDLRRLEARLVQDPDLRNEFRELRRMRTVLRSLPRERARRNFTLTPEMVGQVKRKPARLYPVLGFASALASILFVLVVLGDFLGYVPSAPGGNGPSAVQEAAPLALAIPEESSQNASPQMKSAAPLEESAAPPETESLLMDEAQLTVPAEGEAFALEMTVPEPITPTDTLDQTTAEDEVVDSAPWWGVGGGAYTETLEMPQQVVAPTLSSELPEISAIVGASPMLTPTFTPTPMPTETPVATAVPIATATPTPTPMPTETPSVLLKVMEDPPAPTSTMEVLAMVGEQDAGESATEVQSATARDVGELLAEEQASQPAAPIRTVLIMQIGLLVLAVITGAAFLILRSKEY